MRGRITITLKRGILDPQGKAIEGALKTLGYDGVEEVRQGKIIDVALATTDRADAYAELVAMCDEILANTVVENYVVEVLE